MPEAPEAPWVRAWNEAQQRQVSRDLAHPSPPFTLPGKLWAAFATALVPVAFLAVPGYPLLQIYALFKLRGPAQLLSMLPVSFMFPIYAFSLYALSHDSNLWPLYMIFASPVAFIITLIVVLVGRRRATVPAA